MIAKLMERVRARVSMPQADVAIIRAFAMGDESLRREAIAAHHRNIRTVGVRGNMAMKFMAEIDTPCPDLILRESYRARIREGACA